MTVDKTEIEIGRDSTHVDFSKTVENFTPSRGRDISGTVYAGAAQNQPTGRALPSLILGTWHSAEDHVRAASHINPYAELINTSLTQRVKSTLLACATRPDDTKTRRGVALASFEQLSVDLDPIRARWAAQLPAQSPARSINFPLISSLTTKFEYEDTEFVRDLSMGMPIAGPIPPTPGLTTRKRAAQSSYAEWQRGIPKRNVDVINRVTKAQGTELSNACWEKTLEEVTAGWVTDPIDLTEDLARTIPLTPRYAIKEQHGTQKQKIRLIDDFRASGVNAIVETDDTNIPENLDVFFAISSFLRLAAPGCNLKCATLDFSHAYKHVPIQENQKEFATIVVAPPAGSLKIATLRTQPFGSKRAPANWSRVTNFVKWLLLVVFRIVISVYVDDIFLIEPSETIDSAFGTVKTVCKRLGFVLEDAKEQLPSINLNLLGAEILISEDVITARLPERKKAELLNELRQVLSKGTLTPAQAAKLRGRLGYSQSLMFGRFGRALMTEFTARRYSKNTTRFHPINDGIRESIKWWIGTISATTPRKITLNPKKPILVYADACGEGHIGIVIFFDGSRKIMHTHLPERFHDEFGIFEFELAGMILAITVASLLKPGHPVLMCGDNNSAIAALVRGNCDTTIGRMLTAVFWAVAAFYGTPVWIEEVRSKFNIADPPSRACSMIEDPSEVKSINYGVTESFKQIFTSKENLLKAQFEFCEGKLSFTGPWACPIHHKAETA